MKNVVITQPFSSEPQLDIETLLSQTLIKLIADPCAIKKLHEKVIMHSENTDKISNNGQEENKPSLPKKKKKKKTVTRHLIGWRRKIARNHRNVKSLSLKENEKSIKVTAIYCNSLNHTANRNH